MRKYHTPGLTRFWDLKGQLMQSGFFFFCNFTVVQAFICCALYVHAFYSQFLAQAAGSRLGLTSNTVCSLGIAIIIAFIHCWQLTLLILSCVPFLIGSHYIQMRALGGHASKDQSALELSGKVYYTFVLL